MAGLLSGSGVPSHRMSDQSICLCMIVKDEAPVIRRCLGSVRPLMDAWLVVDTGSTDGTQAIARETLADLPGALVEGPWVDFAHNRSEALALARPRADYTFVIDADDELLIPPGFVLPSLDADGGRDASRKWTRNTRIPWAIRPVHALASPAIASRR